ncbi:MAG: hypothetical protein AB1767_04890 [Bacillota bacterium]
MAKCETAPGKKSLPLQALRYCGARFLYRELDVIPADWVIIAVGREAYKALAYLMPARTILGCPHPTGSHGHFNNLFKGDTLVPEAREIVEVCLESKEPVAAWLTNVSSGQR